MRSIGAISRADVVENAQDAKDAEEGNEKDADDGNEKDAEEGKEKDAEDGKERKQAAIATILDIIDPSSGRPASSVWSCSNFGTPLR